MLFSLCHAFSDGSISVLHATYRCLKFVLILGAFVSSIVISSVYNADPRSDLSNSNRMSQTSYSFSNMFTYQ